MTSSGTFLNNSWPFLFNILVAFLGGGGSLLGGGLTLEDLGGRGILGDLGDTLEGGGRVLQFLVFYCIFLTFFSVSEVTFSLWTSLRCLPKA